MKSLKEQDKVCFLERLLWKNNKKKTKPKQNKTKTPDMRSAKLKIRKQQNNYDLVKKDINGLYFQIVSVMEKTKEICYILKSWVEQDSLIKGRSEDKTRVMTDSQFSILSLWVNGGVIHEDSEDGEEMEGKISRSLF